MLLNYNLYQNKQNKKTKNHKPLPININQINTIILSHTHLNHSNHLPILLQKKYYKPIYITQPTIKLIKILLKNTTSLQKHNTK